MDLQVVRSDWPPRSFAGPPKSGIPAIAEDKPAGFQSSQWYLLDHQLPGIQPIT